MGWQLAVPDCWGVQAALGEARAAVERVDPLDRAGPAAVEAGLGQGATAGFDRVYNQTSVTDARGTTTTTAVDALNRAVMVTDAPRTGAVV